MESLTRVRDGVKIAVAVGLFQKLTSGSHALLDQSHHFQFSGNLSISADTKRHCSIINKYWKWHNVTGCVDLFVGGCVCVYRTFFHPFSLVL